MEKYNSYINLNSLQLDRKMQKLYKTDLEKFGRINQYLKTSDRYKFDYVFRIQVDTFSVVPYLYKGEYDLYIDTIESIFDEIYSIGLNENLIGIYFILGNAYSSINMIDKAVYCFMKVINVGEQVGSNYVAYAYNNIGTLYSDGVNLKTGLSYMIKASELADKIAKEKNEYSDFWVYNMCAISIMYYESGEYEKFNRYYENCIKYVNEKNSSYIVSLASIYYNCWHNNVDNVIKVYEKAFLRLKEKKLYPALIHITMGYYDVCKKLKINIEKVIPAIKCVADISYSEGIYGSESNLLQFIADYYIEKNDIKNAKEYIVRFCKTINHSEILDKEQEQKILALKFKQYLEVMELNSKSNRLKKISEDLLNKNKKISEVYDKLTIIQNIGSEVSNSNSEMVLVEKLFTKFKSFYRIDNFILISKSIDDNCFKFCFDAKSNDKTLIGSLNFKNSIVSKIINEKKTVDICMLEKSREVKELFKVFGLDKCENKSIVIEPMIFKDEVIGLALFIGIDLEEISFDFINQISVFISIVLNNIQKENVLLEELSKTEQNNKELKKSSEKLYKLSNRDFLTKVPNRRCFDNFYEKMLKKASAKGSIINIYMIDIDHFKKYNDTLGHLKGDEVLVSIAKKLTHYFRDKFSILARYGGEEFIGLTINYSLSEAIDFAETIRKGVEDMDIRYLGEDEVLTISIGVSTINKPVVNGRDYIKLADKALYDAKSSGRNCVKYVSK